MGCGPSKQHEHDTYAPTDAVGPVVKDAGIDTHTGEVKEDAPAIRRSITMELEVRTPAVALHSHCPKL